MREGFLAAPGEGKLALWVHCQRRGARSGICSFHHEAAFVRLLPPSCLCHPHAGDHQLW